MPAALPDGQDASMTRVAHVLLCSSLAGLVGCPAGGGEEPPAPVHSWYEGTLTATKPEGDPLGEPTVSLLRRSVLPAEERIEERWVELDENGTAFDVIASITVALEEGTFRSLYQDEFGVLEGFGSFLNGDDWAWTAWEAQVEYTSGELTGTSLRTLAEVAGGVLTADTEVIGSDSVLEVIEVRELEAISEATFDQRAAELLGG